MATLNTTKQCESVLIIIRFGRRRQGRGRRRARAGASSLLRWVSAFLKPRAERNAS